MCLITSRDKRFFDLALKIADNSECASKHGAIITDGSNIISISCNKRCTHPVTKKYVKFDHHSIHAEQRSLIKARSDVKGMTLYSAKSNGNKKSKPCFMCNELLKEAKIKTIIYNNGKELVKERL